MLDKEFYKKYCGQFIVANLVIVFLVVTIAVIFKWEIPSSFSLVLAMISAYYPASSFIKINGRLPTKSETRHFSFGSLVAACILSSLYVGLAYVLAGKEDLEDLTGLAGLISKSPIVFFVIVIVSLAITYFMISFGFKSGAKNQMKQVEKLAQKNAT